MSAALVNEKVLPELDRVSFTMNHLCVGCGTIGVLAYSVVDWFLNPVLWFELFVFRVALALFGVLLLILSAGKKIKPNLLLVLFYAPILVFVGFVAPQLPTLQAITACNLHLAVIVIFVASAAIIPQTYLFVLSGISIAAYLGFYAVGSVISIADSLVNGGGLYLLALALLPFIGMVRFRMMKDNLRMKAQIEVQNRELTELNVTKDRFFSLIAHDLRGPIGSSSKLLDRVVADGNLTERREDIEIVSESLKQVFSLLENLLLWAKSQKDEIKFNPMEQSVLDQVDFVVRSMKFPIAEKRISVTVEIPETDRIMADQNMFRTIVRNLLSNAVKFTHPDGSVTIASRMQNGTTTIEVRDTGIGMSKAQVDRLFKIEDKQRTDGTGGEFGGGLGLILCGEFVEKNRGTLRVESETGRGSAFFVELPSG